MPTTDDDNCNPCCHRASDHDTRNAYCSVIREELARCRNRTEATASDRRNACQSMDEFFVARAHRRATDPEVRRLVRSLPYGLGGRRPAIPASSQAAAEAALAHLASLGLLSSLVVQTLTGEQAA